MRRAPMRNAVRVTRWAVITVPCLIFGFAAVGAICFTRADEAADAGDGDRGRAAYGQRVAGTDAVSADTGISPVSAPPTGTADRGSVQSAARTGKSFVYRKQNDWRSTWEATLRANGFPVFGPWSQVEPFDPILRRPQPPEEQPLADDFELFGGGRGSWRLEPSYRDGYANTVDTGRIPQAVLEKKPTVVLKRTIIAAKAQPVRIYLGCDAGLLLHLNGKPLLYADTVRELQAGQETVVLPLWKGENTLTLKVSLARRPCRFFFLPDFGEGVTEELVSRLHHDFPDRRRPLGGYRERAALRSADAEAGHYRLVEIPTPPGVVIEGGGMDFLPDGRLAVCTRRGFVYLIENPGSDDPAQVRFHRFAQGLHEPLGLMVVDGVIHVVQKPELTRLLDTDGDDRADRFEAISNAWGLSESYHEYAYGLVRDAEGAFYVPLNLSFGKGSASAVPYRGWVVRITREGEMEPFCAGFRSPAGIGTNLQGDVFVTDNQGEWVPACPLYHIRKGKYYGHPASLRWADEAGMPELSDSPAVTPPAVWFPYEELCQSATDVVCDTTGGRFGPFPGQLFVGEMTKGLVVRVQLEKVAGQWQGACFAFRRGCGAVIRMTFGPDSRLYLTRNNRGWGGGGLGDGVARLEYTGIVPMEIHSVHLAGRDGFELTFTRPLREGSGTQPDDYELEQYGYHHWSTYGSPKIDRRAIAVRRVEVSPDRRRVRLVTETLEKGRVCRITVKNAYGEDGRPVLHPETHYTLNAFPTKR